MENKEKFIQHIQNGYTTKGDYIVMGAAMLDGDPIAEAKVKVPLKTLNRHGLIAGATGTGKTKTLQILAENLSEKGIPVLLMDIKGDLSGIAKPAENNPKLIERHEKIGFPFEPSASPVEILSLSEQPGVRLKATVSEFGPVLLSRILDLSDTQAGIMGVIFQYCDHNHLPLLDLKDLKRFCSMPPRREKRNWKKITAGSPLPLQALFFGKLLTSNNRGHNFFSVNLLLRLWIL